VIAARHLEIQKGQNPGFWRRMACSQRIRKLRIGILKNGWGYLPHCDPASCSNESNPCQSFAKRFIRYFNGQPSQ
jgi:hypothetical protein